MSKVAMPIRETGARDERLRQYTELFREAFRRRDQARWAAVYLQALLADAPRKNVEALAKQVASDPDLANEDVAQALQNFVNQSPWDESALWRRYRSVLGDRLGHERAGFVVDEMTFPKHGQHSIGVHRQFSQGLGRKTNCQLAVAVHYVSPLGYVPLGLRLYLPRPWITHQDRLHIAGVPAEERAFASKAEIGLKLLEEIRAEGMPGSWVVMPSYFTGTDEIRQNLATQGLDYLVGVDDSLRVRPYLPDGGSAGPLSLGELARSDTLKWSSYPEHPPQASRFAWVPAWLPAAKTDRAWIDGDPVGVLIEDRGVDGWRFALGNLPAETGAAQAVQLWQQQREVDQGCQRLRDRLGLDHFEGRSWRGFHHHACLVMVAFGYLAWERSNRKP